jgi:hypothetical protein
VNARAIRTTAVDNYLRLVRLPLDTAIGLLPGNGGHAAPTARLAIDRADATIRAILGTVLGDSALLEGAQQRRDAAEERERALRLRREAERTTEHADSRFKQRTEQVERQRELNKQRVKARSKAADRKRNENIRHAGEVERTRTAASRNVAARAEAAVDERAPKARLQTLDTKAAALREKEQALTARDEARRLREAAARTKAERKNSRR